METKNTPGPWRYYTKPQPNGCPIVGDTKGMMVAMLAHTINESDQKETAEANAALISAAPDLLSACEEFVRKCDSGEARSTRSYKQMKAAIAKATGATDA